MTTPTEMPAAVRTTLFGAAVLLGVIAAGGNLGHVFDAVRHAGQGKQMSVVISLMPDVLMVLCIFKLRYDPRSPWAWAGLFASVGFIIWASVVTSKSGLGVGTAGTETRRAVALSPLVVAVIAAGLIEPKKPDAHSGGKADAGSTTPVAPSRRASKTNAVAPKPPAASPAPATAGPKAGPETPPSPGRPLHLAGPNDQQGDALLPDARTAAKKIRDRGEQVTKRTLMAEMKAAGVAIGDKRALELLKEVA